MIHLVHLETDVTTACQLSCVACNHEVPLWRKHGPMMIDPSQVANDLRHLSSILHTDVWGALGGEPLLHPKLPEILMHVHLSGIADRIEVWTNGIAVMKQSLPFWMSPFHDLVLSAYPGHMTDELIERIRGRCEQFGKTLVLKDERNQPNFKTLLEPTPTNPEQTRAKFAGCFFRHFSRNVTNGYFFTCCCAPHMPMLIQGKPFGTDGIRVEGITEEQLLAYLTRTEPLGACTDCAGRDTAVNLPWSEEKDPTQWELKSKGFNRPGDRVRVEVV